MWFGSKAPNDAHGRAWGMGQIRAPRTSTVKNTSVGAAEADLGCRRAAGRGGADNKKGDRNGPEVALGSHVREGELWQSALDNPGAVMMFPEFSGSCAI